MDHLFDADGLHALRATLAAHASQLGVDDVHIEHLIIVASELATNAVRHGGGGGRLRLWQDDGVLYCEVSDEGPGIADPTVGTWPPDPSAESGRGVWICRQLAERFTIGGGRDGRGATVTAELRYL